MKLFHSLNQPKFKLLELITVSMKENSCFAFIMFKIHDFGDSLLYCHPAFLCHAGMGWSDLIGSSKLQDCASFCVSFLQGFYSWRSFIMSTILQLYLLTSCRISLTSTALQCVLAAFMWHSMGAFLSHYHECFTYQRNICCEVWVLTTARGQASQSFVISPEKLRVMRYL